ncbi:MAG: helix-turn-helix domain-containing protein [Myxococcota bacterium]
MPLPLVLPATLQDHDFEQLHKREKHPRVKSRLLAMLHLSKVRPYKEVAEIVRMNEKTILDWIHRFDASGLDGLQERAGRGAKRRIKADEHERFKQAVLDAQQDRSGGHITGEKVQRLLKEQFQVQLGLSSVYNLRHRIGLSWVSARSQHPKPARDV